MNNKNIGLFNYVYSAVFENEKEDDSKWTEFKQLCLKKMNYSPYDFIKSNEELLTMNKKNMWQDLYGTKETVGVFVILNLSGNKEFINYKVNEIKSIIKTYGVSSFNNIGNVFENMCNESIRELLFEFKNNDLINFEDYIFVYADDRIFHILFENITVITNKNINGKTGNIWNINNSGQLIAQLGNNNSAINKIEDTKLFDILSNKIEAIKVELKNKNCDDKIEELEKAIYKKDKQSVTEILSHLSSFGSFIASTISMLI